jgi:hypothetical protein
MLSITVLLCNDTHSYRWKEILSHRDCVTDHTTLSISTFRVKEQDRTEMAESCAEKATSKLFRTEEQVT